jgi:hypothetical protein
MIGRRNIRGQATTELALGSLVFVVVLLFGIYFGEVPVMMLKVKEAANFSVNHATGSRTHLFSLANINGANTYDPFEPAQVGVDTRLRYNDFDGMSDSAGSTTFTQAMTSASNFRARCSADNRVSFAVDATGASNRASAGGQGSYDATGAYLRNRFRDRGGVGCTISASATPFRVPTSFLDSGGGKMSEEQLKTRATFRICGAGRPNGNVCNGELLVLTGDWGFDGPMGSAINGDAETVQDNLTVNDPYVRFVQRLYELNGESQGNAGRKLLNVVAGVQPNQPEYLDESIFNMSFQGDRGGHSVVQVDRFIVDPLEPRLRYQTSGADMRSNYVGWDEKTGVADGIPPCFLGLAGCAR